MTAPRTILSAALLLLLGFVIVHPASASASETTFGVAVAHGDQSSQAYDLFVTHAFSPWIEGERAALSPLVEGGLQLWERSDKTIWGGNANVGLMLRFANGSTVRPFIIGTFGIAQISSDQFGNLDLGCKTQFRSRGSIGVDFGEGLRHTVKCSVTHYSNASMSGDNDGYNTLGLSYGLTF